MALAANSMEGKAERFLERIENVLKEGETAKAVYMNECKDRREGLKDIYTEAKDAGVPIKALKGVVKMRSLERKIDAISDGFDIDEAAAYKTLCDALGPLGEAAAAAAGHPPKAEGRADEANLVQIGQGN